MLARRLPVRDSKRSSSSTATECHFTTFRGPRRSSRELAADITEFLRTYESQEGWQGYWGAPALASAEIGDALTRDLVERSVGIAEKVIASDDVSDLPSYPDSLPPLPEADALVAILLERYDRQTAEIDTWLAGRRSGDE